MILLARNRLRALIVLIFAHDMQIHVAHALCKQGCRLISYTANIRLVTIAACYNFPRSPLLMMVTFRIIIMELVCLACLFYKSRAHCVNIFKGGIESETRITQY